MTEKYLKQLKIIGIIHYVFAALGALAIIGVSLMVLFITQEFLGFTNAVLASGVAGFIGLGCVYLFNFLLAQNISSQKHFMFCNILSGLYCLSFPFGTAIGIWSLIILNKPEVKALFYNHTGTQHAEKHDEQHQPEAHAIEAQPAQAIASTHDKAHETNMPHIPEEKTEAAQPFVTEYVNPNPAHEPQEAQSKETKNDKSFSVLFSNQENPWLNQTKQQK